MLACVCDVCGLAENRGNHPTEDEATFGIYSMKNHKQFSHFAYIRTLKFIIH